MPTGCPPPPSSSSSVPLSKILPPVLIITFAFIVVGLLVWRRQKRQNKDLSERLITTEQEKEHTQHQLEAIRKVWEIDWSEVQQGECIGQGAMCQVWKGYWRGMAVAVHDFVV